jgi:hypothetical protein
MTAMQKNQWKEFKSFSEFENWGDPEKMNYSLIAGLQELRNFVGREIVIHYGFEKRDGQGWHPKGRAVDLHIVSMHPIEQFIAASRFRVFTGIGTYLWWNSPGLHLDNRPLRQRSIWGSLAPKKYCSMDISFLREALRLEKKTWI